MLPFYNWRLKVELKEYRNIVENASVGIYQSSLKGELLYANKALAEIFEYDSIEEFIKAGAISRYKNIGDREIFIEQLKSQGKIDNFELELLTKKGNTKYLLLSTKLDENKLSGVIRDISERKKTEIELEVKRHTLFQQNKRLSDFLNILEITATSMDFHATVNKLSPFINKFLGSTYCVGYHLNEKVMLSEPSHQYNLTKESLAYFLSSGFSVSIYDSLVPGHTIRFIEDLNELKLPANVNNFSTFLRYLGSKSIIIMPFVYKEHVESIFINVFPDKRKFKVEDREMARRIYKHLAASYISSKDTANLLSQTLDQTQQFEIINAMNKIDEVILTSSSKEEVLWGAVQLFSNVVANDAIEVLEIDNKLFNLIARFEKERVYAGTRETFKFKEISSYSSVAFKIPAYIPDLSLEKILGKYEKRFLDISCKALLVIPLLAKGEVKGFISIASKNASTYSSQHCLIAQRLANQIAIALANTELVQQVGEMLIGVVDSLVTALDAKSPWTHGHSRRVSQMSLEIGNELMLDDSQLFDLRLAALFHDIGKIGTYDIVLDKPGKLNKEEIELIKSHPRKTYEILSPIQRLKNIAKVAMHHHEKWGGGGYPDGLAGDDIPYLSRIIAIADAYDAMCSDRPYRKALETDEIINEISEKSGIQFDPDIAKVFTVILTKKLKKRAA